MIKPAIEIRLSKKSDAKNIVSLVKEFCASFGDTTKLTAHNIYQNCFGASKTASAYLAFVDDQIAGFAITRTWMNLYLVKKFTHIDYLYVREVYRKKGIAQNMLTTIANKTEKGILSIDVDPKNKAAVRLYQKLGFIKRKISRDNLRLSGSYLTKRTRWKK